MSCVHNNSRTCNSSRSNSALCSIIPGRASVSIACLERPTLLPSSQKKVHSPHPSMHDKMANLISWKTSVWLEAGPKIRSKPKCTFFLVDSPDTLLPTTLMASSLASSPSPEILMCLMAASSLEGRTRQKTRMFPEFVAQIGHTPTQWSGLVCCKCLHCF